MAFRGPRTHVWEEAAVKPGDTIKLIDKLTPEERAAVRQIRELGDTRALDTRAKFAEAFAGSLREHATASKILDENPWLESMHYEPRSTSKSWAVATAVTILAVAVITAAVNMRSPTLPAKTTENASPSPPSEPKEAPSAQKGRGDPPAPSRIANRLQVQP